MKTFLTTAAIVAALAFPAYAEGEIDGSQRGESANTLNQSQQGTDVKAGMDAKGSGAKASGAKASGAMAKDRESTGAGTAKDSAGSKDAPGDKTGVSGGARN